MSEFLIDSVLDEVAPYWLPTCGCVVCPVSGVLSIADAERIVGRGV